MRVTSDCSIEVWVLDVFNIFWICECGLIEFDFSCICVTLPATNPAALIHSSIGNSVRLVMSLAKIDKNRDN